MKTFATIALCIFLLTVTGSAHAGFISAGLEEQMYSMDGDDMVKVLVVMNQQANIRALDRELHDRKASLADRHLTVVNTLRNQASSSQAALIADLESNKAAGAILGYTPHWIVNGIVMVGTVDAIREIAARDDVERVEPDLVVELIEPVPSKKVSPTHGKVQGIGITPGVVAVGARRVWEELGVDGTGVIVGILDTGVDGAHVALSANWRGNFADPSECWIDAANLGQPNPADTHGHGSHVMGTIMGQAPDDTIGVAPGALWIASNIINSSTGTAFDNGVIASLEFMADPDGDPQTTEDLPAVVQNSWGVNENFTGYFDCDSRWWNAIDNCEAAGVVLTWSAGNEGPGGTSMRSPADRAASPGNCFSVGSTITSAPYTISSFSSRGPSGCGGAYAMKPEICAPGSDIYSVLAGGGYTYLSGTSMAGPHIAGVVALMRASNPNVDVITVKDILMNTAIDLGAAGEDNIYGHGFVDAYEAVLSVMSGIGAVEGVISDAQSGSPIEGAKLKKVGAPNQAFTDIMGYYNMTMPAGFVDLEVSSFGYETDTMTVEIVADVTIKGNLALVPLPTNTVSGLVYGPDSNVVSGATVEAVGTPVPAAVTDTFGYYSLVLPSGAGSNYSLRSRADGLGHVTQNIELLGDMTLDFYLPELFAEDFESGDFSTYLWDQGVNPWTITTVDPQEGSYCARSGAISDNQNSQLSITMEIADFDSLTFWYKVSSESNYDYLRFYLDGSSEGAWSGSVGWTRFAISIAPGSHTFLWSYEKDGSVSSGDDAAYIDYIEFPEQGTPGTPAIELSDASISSILGVGSMEDKIFTVGNTGTASLSYSLGVVEDPEKAKAINRIPYLELEKGEEDPRASIVPQLGSGGPDGFGYSWTDSDEPGGPVYNWIDISGSGQPGPTGDDDSQNYPLGFNFSYYGVTYNSINVCTNGFLSFTSTDDSYTHQAIPNSAIPNDLLAVFWDDLNPLSGGNIYYQSMGDKFVVQYSGLAHYGGGNPETFQVILNTDGSIVYQYDTVSDGSGCSVGIENSAGDDGLQVVFNGAYLHDDLAIRFATTPPITWVTLDPLSGLIPVSGSEDITVHFDATGLAYGTYNATMTVSSTDPGNGSIDVPITLVVGDPTVVAGDQLPGRLRLTGAVPNPFNPVTQIRFDLPRSTHVDLRVHDVAGRLVRKLMDEKLPAGAREVRWAGQDDSGRTVASGTYFIRLSADDEILVKRMVLLR